MADFTSVHLVGQSCHASRRPSNQNNNGLSIKMSKRCSMAVIQEAICLRVSVIKRAFANVVLLFEVRAL